jgi:MauM/NapG family ferredoxin protein
MNRRGLLALAAGALSGLLARRPAAAAALRPPGALPPGAFERACIGCFRCAEVCPTRAIRFPATVGLDAAQPFLELRETACVLCMACTEVCPTGALAPIPPLPARVEAEVRIGVPVLDRRSCLAWSGQGVCRLCAYVCPVGSRAVELVGPQQAPLFHAEACVGCGLCEEACPVEARAIRIVPAGGRA